MKNSPILSWIGTTLTGFLSYISLQDVKEIISWILSIIVAVLTIGFTIYSWYKKASADGHITSEEIDELKDIIDKEKNNGTRD